jgi:hypothetical protein
MTKYLLLFRKGFLEKTEQSEELLLAWDAWVEKLAHEGRFVSGLPFGPKAKVISGVNKAVTDFQPDADAVAEYILIQATSLDEAIEIAKGSPNLQYGGSVEVRSTIPPAQ